MLQLLTPRFTLKVPLMAALGGLALVASASAQVLDIVGSNVQMANGSGLAKGNSFEVIVSRTLTEVEAEMAFTGTQMLRFTVHSSPMEFGNYTEIFQGNVQATGVGQGFYSSGPISVPLDVGTHYIISVGWDGNSDYFFDAGPEQPVSFGAQTHGYATGQNPLPMVFSSQVNDQAIYSQRLTTVDASGGIGTAYCMANTNSTGVTGDISATGSRVVATNDLTLTTSNLPNNAFGFFIVSQTQAQISNPGGSAGNLCIAGAVGRYVGPGEVQNTGSMGGFSLLVDLSMTPQPMGFVAIMPGETWNFTAWHRDAAGGMPTSNFTDGVAIMFL